MTTELEQEAMRYRWLKEHWDDALTVEMGRYGSFIDRLQQTTNNLALDAAIDAEIEKEAAASKEDK